jgi:HK97 family phage major capsid protein
MNVKKFFRRSFRLMMLACAMSMFLVFGVGGGSGSGSKKRSFDLQMFAGSNRKQEIEARKAEIRGIITGENPPSGAALDALEIEIRSLNDELAQIDERERRQRIADGLNAGVITGTGVPKPGEQRDAEDPYNTLEYRKAFKAYCQNGTPIPRELRADAFTDTTEAAAVIPTTILNEIIKKMTAYGQVFNRVRKTNVPGGMTVPILSLKPVATWITEALPSERKEITINTNVSFNYYGLECKVATSLLANIVTLPIFETTITDLIVEAMVKAMELAVIKGTGAGSPLGVTLDPRIPVENVITLAAADFVKWDGWKKKVFAKIPLAYRSGGSFIMAAGTFEGYIDGMVDSNGQPIGRVNYGITNGPQERFGGREVILVEDDVVAPYDVAAVGDVVAVFIKLSDYCINSNLQMTMYRWLDQDKNQWVDKAILVADGKILDPNGVLIIKKGA